MSVGMFRKLQINNLLFLSKLAESFYIQKNSSLGGLFMRTIDIAKSVGVHVNTVRLYEQWHYISPVPRSENGYRQYSQLHLMQMKIARLAFRQEFIQNNLRKSATKIVQLRGQQKFPESFQAAKAHFKYLQSEYNFAQEAVIMANNLLNKNSIQHEEHEVFTHQQVAQLLHLSEETIRNWERNGLYSVKRDAQNRRHYTASDIQKLRIIRVLRSAHFSISSILHLFEEIDGSMHHKDLQDILNSPKFKEEFYHVTDQLQHNLKKAMKDVKSIIAILKNFTVTGMAVADQ